MRSHKSPLELTVTSDAKTGACAVRNRLGVRIKELVLCDESGVFFTGSNIAPGAQAQLTHAEPPLAKPSGFVAELKRHPTLFPGNGVDGSSSSRGLFGPPSYRYSWQINNNYHSTNTSLLEREMTNANGAAIQQTLKPRSYLAIVERPDHILTGMDGLIESQSVHVISGTW